jgi:hypothetical protein
MSTLWPRLGFTFVGGLDYAVTVLDAPGLMHVAGMLDNDKAHRTYAVGVAATVLRQLAQTPAALKSLNRIKPQTPRSVRGINVAAHYLVAKERLGKAEAARKYVIKAWAMTHASVVDDITDYRREAQRILGKLIEDAGATRSRAEILQAIDDDMCSPRASLYQGKPGNGRGRKSKA